MQKGSPDLVTYNIVQQKQKNLNMNQAGFQHNEDR